MILLILFLLVCSMILAAPARYYARRDQRWFLSDNATVFAPVIFWFLLVILGVGS